MKAACPALLFAILFLTTASDAQEAAEQRLYIGVEDITATPNAVTENGGAVDAPRFEVPGVVVLGLFRDSAGNPMGLVEMESGTAKIP